jgi:hypothetical protein
MDLKQLISAFLLMKKIEKLFTIRRHSPCFFSTLLFAAVLWLNQGTLGKVTGLADLPQIIQLSIFIIALDTLSTIPFARLRQEGRPVKFAAAKIIGIIINVFFTWFFISYCAHQVKVNPNSWVSLFYDTSVNPIIYV